MRRKTIRRAWIYPCCNGILIALERPQSPSRLFLSLMVRAGYVCIALLHRTLTWTSGSLSCAQMLMHAIAHGQSQRSRERRSSYSNSAKNRRSYCHGTVQIARSQGLSVRAACAIGTEHCEQLTVLLGVAISTSLSKCLLSLS